MANIIVFLLKIPVISRTSRAKNHILMKTPQKRGRGVLIFITYLQILMFFNNRYIFYFCGQRGNWSFFEDVINVLPPIRYSQMTYICIYMYKHIK